MHLTHVRAKRGGTAIGSIQILACPHCSTPPRWIRLFAMAGMLVALTSWLLDVPHGAFPFDWPRKFAAVCVVAATVSVLTGCYGSFLLSSRNRCDDDQRPS